MFINDRDKIDRKNLFSIGEAANAYSVTPRTLRHYEEIGLLQPNLVDIDTGYRYYTVYDLEHLMLILNLKNTGMHLDEILHYFQKGLTLSEQITRLRQQQERIMRSIETLQDYSVPKGVLMPKRIQMPERLCVTKRVIARDFEDAFRAFTAFVAQCAREGIRFSLTQHKFCEFPPEAFSPEGLVIENFPMKICICVEEATAPTTAEAYPAQPAVSVTFRGAYEQLGEAYDALYAYIAQQNLVVDGNSQETYLDKDLTGCDSDMTVTRVAIPVKA